MLLGMQNLSIPLISVNPVPTGSDETIIEGKGK